jgi:hypothetical protein
VSEVTTVFQRHGKEFVAGLEYSEVDADIGLAAGVGLYVGVVCIEEFFDAVDGELFGVVNMLAAAIVAFSRIPFGIFVGEDGAYGFKDRRECEVFGSDELDVILLASGFCLDDRIDLRINVLEGSLGESAVIL